MNLKQSAAEAAIPFIESGMTVGLGTGSTADYFLKALGEALRSGRLRDVRGIPTSRKSADRAQHFGIPLATLAQCPVCDITVDGADEVDGALHLIKGLGGALLRERIVAQNSRKMIVIIDPTKLVASLGTRAALPVEVTPFGHETHPAFFRSLGAVPTLRADADGKPFITDNGNCIYDCRFPSIPDPTALEVALLHRAGVAGTGLFIGIATTILIGEESSVRRIERAV
jgi:ribose 5-phosphate isomerase A